MRNIIRYGLSSIFISCFGLVFLYPINIAAEQQVYEYRNAAGRMVRTLTPPPMAQIARSSADSGEVGITQRCRDDWGKNYEMREYCMKNQKEARRKLGKYSADIIEFCRKDWGDNYEMLEYCAKNQSAARRRIGD